MQGFDGPMCIEIFAQARNEAGKFVDRVNELAPNAACELHQVSPHVADPISPDEVLVRLVVDDTHVENDGTLSETFMNDASSFGASTLRLGRAKRSEFEETINLIGEHRKAMKRDPERLKEVIGYVRFPVAALGALVISTELHQNTNTHRWPNDKVHQEEASVQAFAVYATGEPTRPNHADVMNNGTQLISRARRNRLASELTKSIEAGFTRVQSLDEILDLGLA